MSYIQFDKNQLINLEYSLSKELLRTNRSGSFSCTTIINCNTRKYHGLLIVPQPFIDGENHVLLSSIDETIVQREAEFNFGIHRYQGGHYSPKGHKYLRDLNFEPFPKLTFNVGGVIFSKEMLFSSNDNRIIIKYTLEDAHSPTTLKLRPYLAFRNIHSLSKANVSAETKYEPIKNGIKMQLYTGYSHLFMQVSKKPDYTHVPDWYYNIEYEQERLRGYDYLEDQLVPGFFEIPLKKGESVYFTAGLDEINPANLSKLYIAEAKRRTPRNNFENCLINSAEQFFAKNGKKTEIIAGYPWFGRWGRDTFISLPGLTLSIDNPQQCKAVIDTMTEELSGPLFPNIGSGFQANYNSVDAPLWFFWALQQYAEYTGDKVSVWKEYSNKLKMILNGYKNGTDFNIKMHDNFLIWSGEPGKALTWMDAIVDGKPVTPRIGYVVEINALWYNAIMFCLEIAQAANDIEFINEWQEIATQIPASFKSVFWSKQLGYLADYVHGDFKDYSVRPNQIFAASLPYNPLSIKIRQLIVDVVKRKLLTNKGLRTLSPKHPDYKGIYEGNQKERDLAYHQGTVWPWLLGHYAEAFLKIYQKSGISEIKALYKGFEEELTEAGIGTISEIYDGDPPHKAAGAISQAWSVAELLRINSLIKKYEG